MMVKAIGLQHVQVTCEPAQLQRTVEFYRDLLGMQPIEDPFHAVGGWFGAGEQSLHLRVEEGIWRAKTKAHPAILVDNLAECEHGLKAAGYSIIPQPKIEGFERFHTFDPSGNRVEVMQRV